MAVIATRSVGRAPNVCRERYGRIVLPKRPWFVAAFLSFAVANAVRNIRFLAQTNGGPGIDRGGLPQEHGTGAGDTNDAVASPTEATSAVPEEDRRTHRSTVVTAYYEIPSKHAVEEYQSWMRNILSMQDAMVIFTEVRHADEIRALRAHALDRTVVHVADLQSLPVSQLRHSRRTDPVSFWQHQLDVDPEKDIHRSYELFWIWLSKSYWVSETIASNPFSSDVFVWVDIGSFRDASYSGRTLVRHPESVPANSMLFMAHRKPKPDTPTDLIWFEKAKHERYIFHSGSLMAGRVRSWIDFHLAFQETIRQYIDRGLFIGEDQAILQSTCYQHPRLCTYINSKVVRKKDKNFFGLRYILHHGIGLDPWYPPSRISS